MFKKKKLCILLAGNPKAGKTTIAHYINEIYGAEIYHFGSAIRKITSELYNVDISIFYNNKFKDKKIKWVFDEENEKKVSPRERLQSIGLGIKQIIDKNIWCKKLYHEKIKYSTSNLFIIDDYRFNEEYEYFKNKDYKVLSLKIHRDESLNDNNKCETQKLKIDLNVNNNGTLEDLFKIIDNILKKINITKLDSNNNSYQFWEWMLSYKKLKDKKI